MQIVDLILFKLATLMFKDDIFQKALGLNSSRKWMLQLIMPTWKATTVIGWEAKNFNLQAQRFS